MHPDRPRLSHPEKDVHRITLYSTVARGHQHTSRRRRLYLHLDMNCFYAQVEQQAWNLYGLPLAMGGWRKPDGTPRGIVATASYEARKLGIKTAMSAYEAWSICPYLVFMRIDYDKYRDISRELQRILTGYAPDVEKYSMDEYFMDVSFLLKRSRRAIHDYITRLKREIYTGLGLVCSVGIATSKTWSKLASGLRKPDGVLMLLTHDDTAQHLMPLPLDEVWGIGSRRAARLQRHGLHTIADAFARGPGVFEQLFGSMQGRLFHEMITGRDNARVLDHSDHIPDEVSYMHTFSDWSVDVDRIRGEVIKAVRRVCYRLRSYNRKARKWACYLRYQAADWDGVQFVFTTGGHTNLDDYVLSPCLARAEPRINEALRRGQQIRGIGLHTIQMQHHDQYELFFAESEQLRRLYASADQLNDAFGDGTVVKAAARHGVPGKTHFLNRD